MKEYSVQTPLELSFPDSFYGPNVTPGSVTYNVTEYFHGADNPDWKQAVKENVQAATSVHARRETIEYSYRTTHADNQGTPCELSRHNCHSLLGSAGWPASDITKAEAIALGNLFKAVKGVSSSFEGLTFLGELRQTTKMLRNPLKSIDEGIGKILRRKKFVVTSRHPVTGRITRSKVNGYALSSFKKNDLLNGKTAAELVLQWNFGILPLYNDVKGIVRALDEKPLSLATRVRGYGEAESISSQFSPDAYNESTVTIDSNIDVYSRVQVIYTAGILVEATAPDALKRLRDRGAFSILDVPATAWELIPWSFLIDYFSNVGDIIASTFTSRKSLRWVVRSEVREWRATMLNTPKPRPGPYAITIGTYGFASITSSVRTFDRTIVNVSDLGIPDLVLELPAYKRQYLNIVALARLLM